MPKTPPPRCADTEDMFTTRPQLLSSMSGRKALVTKADDPVSTFCFQCGSLTGAEKGEKGGDDASLQLAGTTDTGWLGDPN